MIPYPSERGIWPNFRSPLAWDFFAISTYLTGSTTFLYLPMIPDFAAVRDAATGLRKKIYRVLALGWQGTPRQWQRLEIAMHIMAIAIIPVAVSVHTIVSWDFAMTPVPMWHSTIFGPYFVAGAIFSGIAALILAMALLRKFLHLEEYLKPIHFENLGKLLLTMSLLWFYFTFAERLTAWYGNAPSEMAVFWESIRQQFAPLFWTMVVCNFIIPVPILAIKRFRTITGTAIASCTVVVGMWLERFLIIVPSLEHKFLPYSWGTYRPTWVEDTLMASSFGMMALLYLLFSKFVPMISIWEMKVGLQPHGGVPATAPAEVSIMAWCWKGRCPRTWRNESPLWLFTPIRRPRSAPSTPCAPPAPNSSSIARQIVIVSGEPHEGYEFTDAHATATPYRWAVLGGAVGGTLGYLLTTLTQKSYPILTGGMSLTPAWTNGIIVYEMTMLGAILTTLVVLLIGAGLPNFKGVITDPEIWNGKDTGRRCRSAGKLPAGTGEAPPAGRRLASEAVFGAISAGSAGLLLYDPALMLATWIVLVAAFSVPVTVTFAPANVAAFF